MISFLVEGAHAHDLATLLDLEGVAIRSGHHCAHPLMQHFGVPATCRASFAFYNTHAEVDAFVAALHKVRKLLAGRIGSVAGYRSAHRERWNRLRAAARWLGASLNHRGAWYATGDETMADESEIAALLREIRDNQREALTLQREHMALYQRQLDRVERINDRAEAMQGRAGKALKVILLIALPLVFLLLALMFLPYLSRLLA